MLRLEKNRATSYDRMLPLIREHISNYINNANNNK